MKIRIKLFALLSRYLPPDSTGNEADLEVPDNATAAAVIADLGLPGEHCHLVLVNGAYLAPGTYGARPLQEGDALAIWPPVAGG
ncbi:MAG TPA: MoaD/ThiS family protein [Rhodospirillales bacterium]|jgi:sulfur carrier protein ThiS|nr:MoaD/ThiS family protein [Rhodospirillales bacterium]